METPFYSGKFADVWKGKYDGKGVAAKVLRVGAASDSERVRKVGCPRLALSINELIASHIEVLQASHSMEDASSSERTVIVGRDNG